MITGVVVVFISVNSNHDSNLQIQHFNRLGIQNKSVFYGVSSIRYSILQLQFTRINDIQKMIEKTRKHQTIIIK